MASGDGMDDDGCLSKLLHGVIAPSTAAVVKVRQAAAAVWAKICACCGNHGPAHEVQEGVHEGGGEAAGQLTRPSGLIEWTHAVLALFNYMKLRWRLLGIDSAGGNGKEESAGPSGQPAEAAGGGGARVPELPLEEIKGRRT